MVNKYLVGGFNMFQPYIEGIYTEKKNIIVILNHHFEWSIIPSS